MCITARTENEEEEEEEEDKHNAEPKSANPIHQLRPADLPSCPT
jgi:hypothetical protein